MGTYRLTLDGFTIGYICTYGAFLMMPELVTYLGLYSAIGVKLQRL